LSVAADGTVSSNGRPLSQIGLYQPQYMNGMIREDGVMFRSDSGVEPVEMPVMVQGFLERSNVDPVNQIARMIQVQRAYELGQNFLQSEDERIRNSLKTL